MQQTVIFFSLRSVHTSNKVAEKGDKVAENCRRKRQHSRRLGQLCCRFRRL